MQDLGTLGGASSSALDINNSGAIVGHAQIGSGKVHTSRAFFWFQGRMEELATGSRLTSSADTINNAGMVAGVSERNEGTFSGCCWVARGLHALPNQSGDSVDVCAIDDQGNVVGAVAGRYSLHGSDACIWRQGRLTLLPVPAAADWSVATAINKHGVIVGWTEGAPGHRPCLWRVGKRAVFQSLGSRDGEANSINDSGIIVGQIEIGDKSHAVAWVNGKLIDLNSTISPSEHWMLGGASCINSRGQIVGWGTHRGHKRGFLLTPALRLTEESRALSAVQG
jgi:probable HAF family extracellular repeat protein